MVKFDYRPLCQGLTLKESSIEGMGLFASEEILGYKIEELINLDFELLLCDDQKLKCNLLHNQVIEGTNYRNLELKMVTKHGI